MENRNQNTYKLNTIEFFVYLIIWMTVFSVPFFNNRALGNIQWEELSIEWIKISVFLLIFILNVYLFIPKLLFTKKYSMYFIFTMLASFLIISVGIWIQTYLDIRFHSQMPSMELGPGMPPMELSSSMPAPMGYKPTGIVTEKSIYMVFLDYMIITLLVIGTSTTLKLMTRWSQEENRRKDIEKEQLKTELALLRHQVNPHFLMNTLNNIHALIDLNIDDAKDAVIKLSVLMRYLLYDSAQGKTTLSKELEFMESYIELMKLRYSNNISIEYIIPEHIPDVQIPSMLFISFLENAFKHGVSYQANSFITFNLEVLDNKIISVIRNSKHKKAENTMTKYSGIGMSNVKKNLELIFNDNYSLDINDMPNEFEVKLTIPLL
jgi:hypothetical protein